jgi:hypothetical protein
MFDEQLVLSILPRTIPPQAPIPIPPAAGNTAALARSAADINGGRTVWPE